MTKISDEEKIAYHSLALTIESAYPGLRKLKERFGSWEAAWQGTKKTEDKKRRETDWRTLLDLGITLILKDDHEYPPQLREIPSPPLGIYILGNLPPYERPALAIVGTRKATDAGKDAAKTFSRELAAAKVTIVSGLAFGVDAAAHQGCLEGGGITVAVLAHGLNEIYPRSHTELGKEIIKRGGALISEYPPGTPSLPYRFLERNRIVSGLSRGILVVEAPENSGALATARFALEQNRDIFVIPGPASHPNFSGSHRLIREGAELVTTPGHILESLGIDTVHSNTQIAHSTSEEVLVLKALASSLSALSVDKIVQITNLEVQAVNQAVSLLLIKNAIKETEHGYAV